MRQHRAFRAAGRAGRVEDRREILGRARDRLEPGGRSGDPLCEGSVARRAEALHRSQSEPVGERAHGVQGLGPAHRQRRLRIAQEIFELGQRIGGVQRQQRSAGAQARKREHDRVGRFVDLRRDPVARLDAERDEGVGGLARALEQRAIGQARCVGCLEGELVRPPGSRFDEIEEIGGDGFRHENPRPDDRPSACRATGPPELLAHRS